ncbi:MAG: SpoIID/LytB domain-containing protein [Vicinamibacterales bacterium]
MSLPTRLHDQAVRGRVRPAAAWLLVGAAATLAAAPADSVVPQTVRVGVSVPGGRVRVETMPLEDYVAAVLSGEGQPTAGAAAQEALAIVIRTFAAANLHRHRAEGYDLCDTTHCQVLRPTLPAARAAALATAGRVLLDGGRPAFVFYSASNGGRPALASEVWPGAKDYAPAAPTDDACTAEPGWTSEITTADLERALRAAGATGRRLRGLSVLSRTPSDRAGTLRVDGFTPDTISAHELRMALGRTLDVRVLRSTAFEVARSSSGYRFSGVGYGHGVGFGVVCAGNRAARGESTAAILRAYFRDLRVGPAPLAGEAVAGRVSAPATVASAVPAAPPTPRTPAGPARATPAPRMPADVHLALPPDDEGERDALLALVRHTRDDVAARAEVDAPALLTITAHASREAFGLATGQPWWVYGATVGTAIDVAPLGALRDRGALESTLRFEVASAVLGPPLADAPAWVRIGAAAYYSRQAPLPTPRDPRVQCPSEAELLRPVSGGAQLEAVARAERCVGREIARGKSLDALR